MRHLTRHSASAVSHPPAPIARPCARPVIQIPHQKDVITGQGSVIGQRLLRPPGLFPVVGGAPGEAAAAGGVLLTRQL